MPGPGRSGGLRGWLSAARRFCFGSLAGGLIGAGLGLKAITYGLSAAGLDAATGVRAISTVGGLALLAGAGILAARLVRTARAQLLWRVRRKLIISYLFIGVVPAILIVTFFVLSGLLLFANLSSFLIRDVVDRPGRRGAVGGAPRRRGDRVARSRRRDSRRPRAARGGRP